MALKLKPVKFTKGDLHRVKDFACGSLPYQLPLADWIKRESLQALANKAKIWLYETPDGELVGYGTLSKSKWFQTDSDGAIHEVKVVCIPTVAVQEAFWGQPKEVVSRDEKYSHQLMRHLQFAAQEWVDGSDALKPLLSLFVHPDNVAAKKLYTRCGFVDFPLTRPDPATGANGQCMVFKLKKT